MARAWQTWTWMALLTTAVGAPPQVAAQTAGAPATARARPEASGSGRTKSSQAKPSQASPEETAPKKDLAAGRKEIEAGIASLQAGKTDLAVQQLTAALSGVSLPTAQMAKALYHRGLAYRQQSKPVQAIADLTNALWLKNGLNESDRTDALEKRAVAYREAGLPDQFDDEPKKLAAPPAEKPSKEAANTDTKESKAAVASANPSEVSAATPAPGSGLSGFFSGLFASASSAGTSPTSTASIPAQPLPDAGLPHPFEAESRKQAAPPAEKPSKEAEAAANTVTKESTAAVAAAVASEAMAAAPASGNGLGGFFSGLFAAASPTGTAPASTASLPARPPSSSFGGWVDIGGWKDGTEVRKGEREGEVRRP